MDIKTKIKSLLDWLSSFIFNGPSTPKDYYYFAGKKIRKNNSKKAP